MGTIIQGEINSTEDVMIEHDLIQGTPEWDEFRLEHDGSSETKSMLGLSMKAPRSELMHAKHTGIAKVFSQFVQDKIFANGHEVEAMARPIVSKQLGARLFPIVCSRGRMSASCDGLTMDGTIGWEHKQFNAELFAAVSAHELPEEFMAQPQQCLLVTGAEKWIFTVSDGTEETMVSMEIFPDKMWFDRIRAGWELFHKDLENYEPQEYIPAAVAAPIKDLPAVLIEVKGEIRINDNLTVFADLLNQYIDGVDKDPSDDQGFADMKAGITALKKAEDALESGEQHALAQLTTFDEMRRMKKSLQDLARVNRLSWEKIVVAKEKQVKEDIAANAKNEFTDHIAMLNRQIGKPYMPEVKTDFPGAMKNKRTLASLREAVNNELVRAKLEASKVSSDICINMNSLRELAKDYTFLFSDTAQLVLKDNEALEAIIKNRIAEHKREEAERIEAQRVKMQAEEEAKARAKAESEAKAKADADAANTHPQVVETPGIPPLPDHDNRPASVRPDVAWPFQTEGIGSVDKSQESPVDKTAKLQGRPSKMQMIEAVAKEFGVTVLTADEWLRGEFGQMAA